MSKRHNGSGNEQQEISLNLELFEFSKGGQKFSSRNGCDSSTHTQIHNFKMRSYAKKISIFKAKSKLCFLSQRIKTFSSFEIMYVCVCSACVCCSTFCWSTFSVAYKIRLQLQLSAKLVEVSTIPANFVWISCISLKFVLHSETYAITSTFCHSL